MTPQSTALQLVIPQYRMHTQLFVNVLDGIKERDALMRINNLTNHIGWMAGNMVNCRYWLANILGIADTDPYDNLFKDAKALDPEAQYPTLEELKLQWHHISPQLYHALLQASDEQLRQSFNFGMGVDFIEENHLNMVGMSLDRESYLLGQLGLMRRILNYPAMRYDVMDKAVDY